MKTIGDRLKFARKLANMTQQQLAEVADGVSQQMISKLESGKSHETAGVLSLAKALECDPYWLANGVGLPPGKKAADEEQQQPTIKARTNQTNHQLDALIGRASPRSQVELQRIAKAAADGRLSDDDLALLHQIAERIAKKE